MTKLNISTTRPGFTVAREGDRVRFDVKADGEEVVSIQFEVATANLIGETLRRAAQGDGEEATGARNAAMNLYSALVELVRLKDLKDSDPAEYKLRPTAKARAWERARAAIAEAEGD